MLSAALSVSIIFLLPLLSACGAETALTSTPSSAATEPVAEAAPDVTSPAGDVHSEESAPTEPDVSAHEPPSEPVADDIVTTTEQSLYRTVAPSQNFDLSQWNLTLPSASTISVNELNSGFQYAEAFYTDPSSGGMVFRCPNLARTTANSSYSRSELRELLAPWDSNTKSNANNWTPEMGGTLKATVRVDHVSVTGDSKKLGRVIIAQIHGPETSEVVRLYYAKKPTDAKGRIYAAFETMSGTTSYSPDIVRNTSGAGLALGEKFRYEVRLIDTKLRLVVRRMDGTVAGSYTKTIDSAYVGKNVYFKAGVYNQNNTGDAADYVQATFFALTHTHP